IPILQILTTSAFCCQQYCSILKVRCRDREAFWFNQRQNNAGKRRAARDDLNDFIPVEKIGKSAPWHVTGNLDFGKVRADVLVRYPLPSAGVFLGTSPPAHWREQAHARGVSRGHRNRDQIRRIAARALDPPMEEHSYC